MSYSGPPQRPAGPGSYFDMFKQANMGGGNFPHQQKFGFFSTPHNAPPPMVPHRFTRPTIHFNVQRKEFPPQPAGGTPPVAVPSTVPPPSSTVPITTVFVGNITEKCSDELIQKIISLCGTINNWKRLQDSNGKFSPFGFCDFDHPDGTMRALRILNDYQLGEKKLTVKADEATSRLLEEFARNREAERTAESEAAPDGPEAGPMLSDDEIRGKIKEKLEAANPDLLNAELAPEEPARAGDARPRSNSTSSTSSSASTRKSRHSEKKATSKHHSSREVHRRSDGSSKRDRRGHSSDSGSRSSSTSANSLRSPSSKRKRTEARHGGRSRSRHGRRQKRRSSSRSSVDSEVMRERRRIRKEIKEKEASYLRRLDKWEQREKRMARKYDKDEDEDLQRRKMIQREAKKLKQFLEDYEDERDDPKYYRSSNLFQRRRNYEKEREADAKDRQEEMQEIEELKKQIMAEKKEMGDEDAERQALALHEANERAKLKRVRSHSGSPTPHRPLGHTAAMAKAAESAAAIANQPPSTTVAAEGEAERGVDVKSEWSPVGNNGAVAVADGETGSKKMAPIALPLPAKPTVVATIQKQSITSNRLNGVFGDEDDDEEGVHQIKKKIRPFEITKEDRIQSLTSEERKKLVKELIEKIPTVRDELFIFAICWAHVDAQLIEERIKPWINKKISEYIGEEEPSLVSFICEKIASRTDPKKILSDLAMVLDEEAEVFMVKLWRLIIYESEAKRLGLSSASSSSASVTTVIGGTKTAVLGSGANNSKPF